MTHQFALVSTHFGVAASPESFIVDTIMLWSFGGLWLQGIAFSWPTHDILNRKVSE